MELIRDYSYKKQVIQCLLIFNIGCGIWVIISLALIIGVILIIIGNTSELQNAETGLSSGIALFLVFFCLVDMILIVIGIYIQYQLYHAVKQNKENEI